MKKLGIVLLLAFLFVISAEGKLFAQATERVEKAVRDLEKEKTLREKIEKKKEEPKIEEPQVQETTPSASQEKTLVKQITVTGVTILKQKDIDAITSTYTNKELYMRDMQKMADMITDAYRKKGYITSRAYLPPQKIQNGVLEVRVVEGITGDINIKGNRYFKTALLRNKIILKKGEPFQYETLKKGLSRINEQPDRNAKAVLAPGQEPGATDVAIEVKDKLPIHAGLTYDDYASRFLDRDRLKATISHNNLLGFEDIFTLQYQLTEAENYTLLSANYLLPVTENLNLGIFAASSKLKLGRDYEDLNARGKSRYYSIFATQSLFTKENTSLKLNVGFDYKDIFNFQMGQEISRDRMRVAKLGLEFDASDKYGRTLFTNEVDVGIPDFMAGLKAKDSAVDENPSKGIGGSRDGSGGKFIKHILNLVRLQRMPWDNILYWKTQSQITSNILTAAEQFQIGGIPNVRGYPAAEAVGDRGFSSTIAWSIPFYFIPKSVMVPYSKARLYDSIRLVTFYDWATARLRKPAAGEEKDKTLRSAGYGIRIMLPENFSVRIEFAWPLDNIPSDGQHLHSWTEISKSF
jgi:hemolysin activation/secretion protein